MACEEADRTIDFVEHAFIKVKVADDEVDHVGQENKANDLWLLDFPQRIEDSLLEDRALQVVILEELVQLSQTTIATHDPLQRNDPYLHIFHYFIFAS